MENQAIRLLWKRKPGRLFLGDAFKKGMIQAGLVLTAILKFSKEDSELFHELGGANPLSQFW